MREQLVDAMAALLVRDASQFDVIVATNMFGDILSDEASELAGSLGIGASLNLGKDHAVAQAQQRFSAFDRRKGSGQSLCADRLERDDAGLAWQPAPAC